MRVGIIHSRWNTVIVDALVSGARRSLSKAGVKDENVVIQSVPGSWELPFAAQWFVFQISSLFRFRQYYILFSALVQVCIYDVSPSGTTRDLENHY